MNTTTNRTNTVSVIVATRDRPHDLARCLPTILANDWEDFEIVVVDQSASDQTAKLVAEIADDRLRYVKHDGKGKSLALNYALPMVRGEVIAFTDDDCTAEEGWLAAIVAPFTNPTVALAFGSVVPVPHDRTRGYIVGWQPKRPRLLQGRWAKLRDGGIGACLAVRTDVARQLRFDTSLGPGGRFHNCEDGDFCYRTLKAGWVVAHVPEARVWHWGLREWRDGSSAMWNTWVGVAAAYTKHVRCGDAAAFAVYAYEGWKALRSMLVNMARLRRPWGVRRVAGYLWGTWLSFSAPVDRSTGLYRPADIGSGA